MKFRPIFVLLIIAGCFLLADNFYSFYTSYKAISGGHINEPSRDDRWVRSAVTPLAFAAYQNDTNEMAMLLEGGTAIEDNHNFRNQCTALHCAAMKGNIAAIAFLLARGAEVNSIDRDNETPLHYAAEFNQAQAVAYLIAHGAAINAKSYYNNKTPLDVAVSKQRVEAARVLLEHGAEGDLDKLIASTKSEMDWAPLAPSARRDQWLKTIALLQEFKEKHHTQ